MRPADAQRNATFSSKLRDADGSIESLQALLIEPFLYYER
jgi:hypothetical protein